MSEPRDEIAEVLAVELHVDCPFGNEHIARLVNRKTGRKLASCPECYDISLIVADTKALAERDRRVAERAWDEGWTRGARDMADATHWGDSTCERSTNPYREATP